MFLVPNLTYIMGCAGPVANINLVPLLRNLIVKLGKWNVKIILISEAQRVYNYSITNNTRKLSTMPIHGPMTAKT